ncbi:ATP synthase subunit I [Thiolapillus brandeum]|nr:ATP synthase subunit I [Thiolapillus brandeum]
MIQPLDRQRIRKLLMVQGALLCAVTLAALFLGKAAALSAFLGGGTALLANALFAFWVFMPYRAQQPGALVTRFYAAEIGKLVLVGLSFAVIFIWLRPLNAAALFVSFFLVQVVSPVLAHGLARDTQRSS